MHRTLCAPAGVSLLVAALLAVPTTAVAQPWVAPKGQGAIALAFQNTTVDKHLAATDEVAVGHISSVAMLADVTYGVTDRIAVDFAVPYIASRYRGSVPHPQSDVDDGRFHGTLADVRLALRYNVTRRGAVITPYVGTSVPSHDYVFYAHAAPGMRLREYQLGVYVGKLVDRVPGLFVSGRYGYGIAERAANIKHDRSALDLEVGYFVSPRWRVFGMASGQYTHGGIDFPIAGAPGLPVELRPIHDQIQKVHYLKTGGGMAVSLTDAIDVFGSVVGQVAGRNGHEMKRGVSVGVSWGFTLRGQSGDLRSSASAAARRPDRRFGKERTLLRCICQKGGRA